MLIHRAAVSTSDGIDFVLSDGSLDRHGTKINPKGWVLDAFKRNPIALFGHSGGFPIGRWENIRVDGGQLLGRLVIAVEGTSARIDELRRLVEQGILRAVSVGFSVIEWGTPGKSQYDIEKQELHEVSLVSVGSNTNALAAARSLNISESTIRLAFGEHAEPGRTVVPPGGNAAKPSVSERKPAMPTLSERIEDAQNELTVKRDKLAELTANSDDVDAIEEMNSQIAKGERLLIALKESEARIGANATPAGSHKVPAIGRPSLGARQKEISGLDLLVRRALVHGVALHTGKEISRVLDERYPDRNEATEMAVMARAAAPLATTGTSGFVSQLVQSTWMDFMSALTGKSVYPDLRTGGKTASFDAAGTAYIPQRTGSGANGSFFAEGSPIRVGRITVAAPTFTSRKMGVIIPFTREAAKRATPDLEGVLRQAILEDTAITLDSVLLDATAEDSIRPAGLLYGVSAAATGYGGGDHLAVKEDFKNLLQPFIDAKAAGGITVIMNPAQSLAIAMMDGPTNNANWFQPIRERVRIVESENATAARLIAVRNADFATALGDMPEFEISNQATIHMEDTSPAEIVSATGPTTANPVRSFWQTDSMGIRMVMDVSWKMARSGVVHWIDGTSY